MTTSIKAEIKTLFARLNSSSEKLANYKRENLFAKSSISKNQLSKIKGGDDGVIIEDPMGDG